MAALELVELSVRVRAPLDTHSKGFGISKKNKDVLDTAINMCYILTRTLRRKDEGIRNLAA